MAAHEATGAGYRVPVALLAGGLAAVVFFSGGSLSRGAVDSGSERRAHMGVARRRRHAGVAEQVLDLNVELRCDEADLDERIARAAEVLQRFWYDRHPAAELMKKRLSADLRARFTRKPTSIGDDGVMMVARR